MKVKAMVVRNFTIVEQVTALCHKADIIIKCGLCEVYIDGSIKLTPEGIITHIEVTE